MGCPCANNGWEPRGVLSPCGERREDDVRLEVIVVQVREVELDVVICRAYPHGDVGDQVRYVVQLEVLAQEVLQDLWRGSRGCR